MAGPTPRCHTSGRDRGLDRRDRDHGTTVPRTATSTGPQTPEPTTRLTAPSTRGHTSARKPRLDHGAPEPRPRATPGTGRDLDWTAATGTDDPPDRPVHARPHERPKASARPRRSGTATTSDASQAPGTMRDLDRAAATGTDEPHNRPVHALPHERPRPRLDHGTAGTATRAAYALSSAAEAMGSATQPPEPRPPATRVASAVASGGRQSPDPAARPAGLPARCRAGCRTVGSGAGVAGTRRDSAGIVASGDADRRRRWLGRLPVGRWRRCSGRRVPPATFARVRGRRRRRLGGGAAGDVGSGAVPPATSARGGCPCVAARAGVPPRRRGAASVTAVTGRPVGVAPRAAYCCGWWAGIGGRSPVVS